MIEWCFTPLSTKFQSYYGDSSHYSCLSWVSLVLGWGSEVSSPRTLSRKTQRIQCGSNPGPLDYELNTLLLSHAGPHDKGRVKKNLFIILMFSINDSSFCIQNTNAQRFIILHSKHEQRCKALLFIAQCNSYQSLIYVDLIT